MVESVLMARKARVEYAGTVYHVLDRRDRREPIFKDDADRRRFLETLGEVWQLQKTGDKNGANAAGSLRPFTEITASPGLPAVWEGGGDSGSWVASSWEKGGGLGFRVVFRAGWGWGLGFRDGFRAGGGRALEFRAVSRARGDWGFGSRTTGGTEDWWAAGFPKRRRSAEETAPGGRGW